MVYLFDLKYFIMESKWKNLKNILLCTHFLETEMFHPEGKLIKAGNKNSQISQEVPETDRMRFA